jgi:hypothetical protein
MLGFASVAAVMYVLHSVDDVRLSCLRETAERAHEFTLAFDDPSAVLVAATDG